MDIKRTTIWTVVGALCVAAIALAAVFFFGSSGNTAPVLLPTEGPSSSTMPSSAVTDGGNIERVEVTVGNVQDVISNTLKRPDSYSRTISIESFWSGGSAVYSVETWVRPEASRIRISSQGRAEVQNIVVMDELLYIWNDGDSKFYSGAIENGQAEKYSDAYQMIETYEDVLKLSSLNITDAGYVKYNEGNCIYIETIEDDFGYREKYYISISTGLLDGAEKWDGNTLIYKMTTSAAELSAPADEWFVLPDGATVLKGK